MKLERLFINGVEETDKDKCIEFIVENHSKIKDFKIENDTLYVKIKVEKELGK